RTRLQHDRCAAQFQRLDELGGEAEHGRKYRNQVGDYLSADDDTGNAALNLGVVVRIGDLGEAQKDGPGAGERRLLTIQSPPTFTRPIWASALVGFRSAS